MRVYVHKSDVFWIESQQSSPCVRVVYRSEGDGIDGGKGGGGEGGHGRGATFLGLVVVTTVVDVASSISISIGIVGFLSGLSGLSLCCNLCGVKIQDFLSLSGCCILPTTKLINDCSELLLIFPHVTKFFCSTLSGYSIELGFTFFSLSCLDSFVNCLLRFIDEIEQAANFSNGGVGFIKLGLDVSGSGSGLGSFNSRSNLTVRFNDKFVVGDGILFGLVGDSILCFDVIVGINSSSDSSIEFFHDGSDQVGPLLWSSCFSLCNFWSESVGLHETLLANQVVAPVFASSVLLVEADDLVVITRLAEAKLQVLVDSSGVEVSVEVTSSLGASGGVGN